MHRWSRESLIRLKNLKWRCVRLTVRGGCPVLIPPGRSAPKTGRGSIDTLYYDFVLRFASSTVTIAALPLLDRYLCLRCSYAWRILLIPNFWLTYILAIQSHSYDRYSSDYSLSCHRLDVKLPPLWVPTGVYVVDACQPHMF